MCNRPRRTSDDDVSVRLTTTHAKVLSFGYSASSVAWNRFCSLWLLKCGFLPRQVGVMKSLSLVGKLLAQPVWAGTADAGNPPAVLAVSIVLSTLTLEMVRLGTRSSLTDRHVPAKRVWYSFRGYVGPVALLRVARSAASAASPVADSMVLALARDGGEAWGRQRFWGSASWGLGSMAVGALIDRFGLEAGLFGVSHAMSLLLLCFILLRIEPGWGADDEASSEDEDDKPRRFSSTLSMRNMQIDNGRKKRHKSVLATISCGAQAVQRSAPLRLVLLNSICFGTLVVSVDSILYMQLEAELQVSRTLSGLATAVSTLATFPVFWSSAELVAEYGHWRLIAIAQCVLPLRLLGHAAVTSTNVAYILLPLQLLHGPMFAAWLSSAVELVDRLAPAQVRASTQSLLTMAYFTIGGCLGHLIWSACFQAYGGQVTYVAAAFCATVSVAAFVLAARRHLLDEHHRGGPTTTATTSASSTGGAGNC